MKRLFSSPDSAEIGLVRSRLEAAAIECEMRNEHLSSAMPGTPFDPELWVLRDSQFAEARELLAAWRQRASPSGRDALRLGLGSALDARGCSPSMTRHLLSEEDKTGATQPLTARLPSGSIGQ